MIGRNADIAHQGEARRPARVDGFQESQRRHVVTSQAAQGSCVVPFPMVPPVQDTWTMKAKQQILSDDISALKRSLLRHQIRRYSAAGLTVRSVNEQDRNIGMFASQPPSRHMASPLRANLLKGLLDYSGNLSSPDLFTYRAALLDRPLRSDLPLLRSSPGFAQTNTSPIAPAPTTRPPSFLPRATNELRQDRGNTQFLQNSITPNIPMQAPPSVMQNINEILHRASVREFAPAAPAAPLLLPSHLNQGRGRMVMEHGATTFPMVLHRALTELELVSGGSEIASFLPDGKSFKIWNQFLFGKHVLPIYFPKMKNFASFQRQLNLYDFERIGGSCVDRGGYHHDMFERDCPPLSAMMKRRKAKGERASTPA